MIVEKGKEIVFKKTESHQSALVDENERPIVVEQTEAFVLKAKSNEFDNPYGCLWQKPGCEGTPLRIGWSRGHAYFFCKCGYDTSSPAKQVYKLAEGFGLLEKE